MNFDVKDLVIIILIGINALQFFLNRDDISPKALENFSRIAIKALREYADKTPSTLDNSLLDLADDMLPDETSEVQAIKIKGK